MKIRIKRTAAAVCLLLACLSAAGCGCGKAKEEDAASTQVLPITITPEPTATPVPSEVNPDAFVTKGNMTMINSYLLEQAPKAKDKSKQEQSNASGGQTEADTTEAEEGTE